MSRYDDSTGPDTPDSWWSQDEGAQYGFPAPEEMPQEGAYDGELPSDVIDRLAAAQLAALNKAREYERIVAERRRRLMAAVRDRATPATPARLCRMLQAVRSSTDPKAVTVAEEALALIARIATATEGQRRARIRGLLVRLGNAPYESSGFDRQQLLAALVLARRCYLETPNRGNNALNGAGDG